MITNKDLIKGTSLALQSLFTPTIRSKGRAIVKKGKVKVDSYSDDMISYGIKGSFKEPYKIEVHYNEIEFEIVKMDCSCPYTYRCEHQAAVLYFLMKEGLPAKKLKKKQIQLIKHKSDKFFFPVTPIKNLDDLDQHTLRQNRQVLGHYVQSKATFISSTELEIKGYAQYISFSSASKPYRITVRLNNNTIEYKCDSCNVELKGFCKHQYGLINKMRTLILNDDLFTENLNHQAVVQMVQDRHNYSKEAVEKFYTLSLDDSGQISLEPKANIISKQNLELIYKKLSPSIDSKKQENQTISNHIFESSSHEALLWDISNRKNHPTIELIMGPKLKTKDSLNISKVVRELDLSNSPKSKYEFINKLNALPQNEASFKKLNIILKENKTQLIHLYHYINKQYDGYGQLRKGQVYLVDLVIEQLVISFKIIKDLDFLKITREMRLGELVLLASDFSFSNYFFSATKDKLFINPSSNFELINEIFQNEDNILFPNLDDQRLIKLNAELSKAGAVKVIDNILPEEKLIQNPEFQIRLREVTDAVIFEPYIASDEFEFYIYDVEPYLDGKVSWVPDQKDVDFLHEYLCEAHPNFTNKILTNFYFLTIDELLKKSWFIDFCQTCEEDEIRILGIKDLQGFKYSTKKADFSTIISSGIDWFDVKMSLSFDEERISTKAWVKALKNGENFVPLKDGTLGILPDKWLARAKKILSTAEIEKDNITISKYKFNVIDELFEDLDNPDVLEFINERRERLENCKLNKSYTIPKSVSATLRDYQHHGYNWLRFLNDARFGGILADDMGLGKTLQVITLLATLKKKSTSLVIVPKSLLFNWSAELDKFCKSLTYLIHHGSNRHKEIKSIIKSQIILTTYDTAASDIELLSSHTFDYIVLDESQAIKNIQSKRYKAMRILNSHNRLAMTGTPIENNTFDLYAQLSFTNPGLLNSPQHFRDNFSNPIDVLGDRNKAELLRKTIHPFILRRTKEQVAKDLPEKTVTTIYCEMGKAQRKLYEDLKTSIREDIENKIEETGFAKSRLLILEGLLRLRQICNSPLLVNAKFRGENRESSKIQLLLENLEETMQGGHSALVFSQFTSLLSIIRKELDDRKIKYAYLDGKTRDREAVVNNFMNKDEIKLFLISIKAGNTGLNLTKADYVYIVDPWWNPAVEAQAIDRTHRIGQKKNIFAYKLICKDSIEEKILKLQEKKKGIADDIIQTDEGVVKKLNKNDLLGLLD